MTAMLIKYLFKKTLLGIFILSTKLMLSKHW